MARICIDGLNLALPNGSGIATYARNLNAAIGSLGHETQILFSSPHALGENNLLNQVSLFDLRPVLSMKDWRGIVSRLAKARLSGLKAREVIMTGDVITTDLASRFPPAQRVWASHDVFHLAAMAHRVSRRFTPLHLGDQNKTDIMHWTAPLPLTVPKIANVYTLHDLIPLRLPFTTIDNKHAFYGLCKTIAARADRIFTVSEHSRQDIIRTLGASEDRVVNTYQAVDVPDRFLHRSSDDVARELEGTFGLTPSGYFLYFGAIEPKKNLKRVVEAYLASGVQTPLVIVGREWLNARQREQYQAESHVIPEEMLSLSSRIKRYQHLLYPSLVTLIQGAKAALFPSLYEGFGLPVLEAMQLGTPVLTSTAASLPEVAGDAALLVDPYDADAICRGIRALDADAGLREQLAAKGLLQAAKFSMDRYRERLREAYAPLI
jgi:glycosyltransferase involved in cell wall biosynthesis